jgi:hypothetical protein
MEILHGIKGRYYVPLALLVILLLIGFILATRIAETGKATYPFRADPAQNSIDE